MLPLLELQRDFRRALLEGDATAISDVILPDGLDADKRLDVYRNNVFASLADVLKDTFPAVCRLVDARFFAYAAYEFLRIGPPERACLSAYGAQFARFLADFPPCQHLVYLPDVARLEWLMNVAAHAADIEPLKPAALAGIDPEDTPRLVFSLHPSFGYLASPWPVDRIWHANRPGKEEDAAIYPAAGSVCLEVSRRAGEIVLRSLDVATFTFRHTLSRGLALHAAADAALGTNHPFDMTKSFADLFHDGALVAVSLATATGAARQS
ncbi:MAG TPA: DNA-binding domain-containing protein [Alphaproteobacteria bacterium]|nr:DNA-binding domain-containing protein [Alphaproteobacteria bacterium]